MSFKTTIILVLVLVLLIGAYFLFFKGKNETEYQKKETINTAYGIEKDRVTKIHLEYKEQSFKPFTLVKNEQGDWNFVEPISGKADNEKINKLVDDLLERKIKRRITNVDDFSKYGLEEPQIEYTIWTDKGKNKFLIGDKGISYSVYAKEADDNSVITLEHTVLEYFTKSHIDLRDYSIFDFEVDKVSQFTLSYPEKKIVCKRLPENNEWQIVEPIKAKADFNEVNNFLNNLNGFKAEAFEEKVNKIQKINIEITVSTENTQTTLQIGEGLPKVNQVYATIKGSSSVLSISNDMVKELMKTVYDLRDKQVIDFQRMDVNKFIIERSEQKIICERDSEGWSITEPINANADKSSIDDFLFRLDSLKAKEFLESNPEDIKKFGLDAPSIKVKLYEVGENVPAILLIGAQKNAMLYVKSNLSEQVFLVENDILEELDKKVWDFRDKRITKFYSGDVVELMLNYDDQSIYCKKHGDDWRIVKPINVDADDSEVNNILYILNKISAIKFVPEHKSLNNPRMSAMVKLNDDSIYTLLIGTNANEESVYAKVKEIEGTFTINQSIVKKLKPSLDDLRK